MKQIVTEYLGTLQSALDGFDWSLMTTLAETLEHARQMGNSVYLCGNGGSAGNAMHLANDFLYGAGPDGNALKVEALSANPAVLTCLGNDIGYDNIFSHQLEVKGQPGDILIALSGSGNSANIVNALQAAKNKDMVSFAILGFGGGKARELADHALHFAVQDMQVSEDTQMIVGHMLMKYLRTKGEPSND